MTLQTLSESIAANLRADMKPKRKWKVTKAGYEFQISFLKRCREVAEAKAALLHKSRARWAASAFLLGCGFGGVIGWLL